MPRSDRKDPEPDILAFILDKKKRTWQKDYVTYNEMQKHRQRTLRYIARNGIQGLRVNTREGRILILARGEGESGTQG